MDAETMFGDKDASVKKHKTNGDHKHVSNDSSSSSSSKKRKRKTSTTKSSRAGIVFSVGRVHRMLKQKKYSDRVSEGASVYLAAVLEYLASETLEIAGDVAHENKKKRITARHTLLAFRNDDELNAITRTVTVPGGGRAPNVQLALVGNKKKRKEYYEGKST